MLCQNLAKHIRLCYMMDGIRESANAVLQTERLFCSQTRSVYLVTTPMQMTINLQ